MKSDFDDSSWKTGPGGFGTEGTPRAVVRTVWNTPDIWLRRSFDIDKLPDDGQLMLTIHHDEDAEVYLNGELVQKATGTTRVTIGRCCWTRTLASYCERVTTRSPCIATKRPAGSILMWG